MTVIDQKSCFIISDLTFKCDIDLGPSHTVLAHCTSSYDFFSSKFLSSYIKFLQIIFESFIKFLQLLKELKTGQAVLSQLTLKCDLDLGPCQMVLAHCIAHYDNVHMHTKYTKFKVILS